MRLLADAGISPKTVEFLKQLGHDTVHVRELSSVNRRVAPVLRDQREALEPGALILVEEARYRLRKLPKRFSTRPMLLTIHALTWWCTPDAREASHLGFPSVAGCR